VLQFVLLPLLNGGRIRRWLGIPAPERKSSAG